MADFLLAARQKGLGNWVAILLLFPIRLYILIPPSAVLDALTQRENPSLYGDTSLKDVPSAERKVDKSSCPFRMAERSFYAQLWQGR